MARPERSRTFLCVLYPDCFEHQMLISYLTQMSGVFEWARILHDKDKVEASTEDKQLLAGDVYKKAHYHYMIRFKDQRTLGTVKDFFLGFCEHFEICHNIQSSLLYFIHMTPTALIDPYKHKYSREDLEGSPKLISQLGLNSHLSQFNEILQLLRSCDGNVVDLISALSEDDPVLGEIALSTIQSYQGIFCMAARQEFDIYKRSNW